MNPFQINGYFGFEYFCDREVETRRIVEGLENGRNITLISLRRMGKSALIRHVEHKFEAQKYLFIYVDIYSTQNLEDFILQLGNAILKSPAFQKKNIFNKAISLFSSLGASINLDPATGQPSLGINFSGKKSQKSLIDILALLEGLDKKVILAIDEFQQIQSYEEKGMEALLRTQIQGLRNCQFVFSGSNKQMMSSIFSDYGRPFYQSTEILTLDAIATLEYKTFIKKWMEKGKINIEEECLDLILAWCRSHTWYVQFICNKIYSSSIKKWNFEQTNLFLREILKEHETVYFNYRNLLTLSQWKVLQAIAKEDGISSPNSSNFINTYKLGAASSVNRAISALLEKEMIFVEQGKYEVYDVFLSRWFQFVI